MAPLPPKIFDDVHDPYAAPPSERYGRYIVDGLKLQVDENERVLWITFSRPRMVNALTHAIYNGLHAILDELQLDRQIRVVVLASDTDSQHFSAGLDFDSHYGGHDGTIEAEFFNQIKFSRITLKFRNIPQPVIALMKGKAVGSGLAYALASGWRFVLGANYEMRLLMRCFSRCADRRHDDADFGRSQSVGFETRFQDL